MQIVLSEKQIKARVVEMAKEISEYYKANKCSRLCVVGILRGGFIFLADLVRELSIPVEIDFVWASSYGGSTKTSGAVSLKRDLDFDIAGKDVMVVEDIVDTGLTMDFMLKHLESKKPKSVAVCSLLHKPAREVKKIPIQFLGFKIEDQFVVGYGLDFNNYYRELKDLVVLDKETINAGNH